MIWYVVTILTVGVLVTGVILWRVLPVLKGTARASDSLDDRLFKWNTNMRPLLRRHLEVDLLIALASVFTDHDGRKHSLAVWSLEPTIMPEVDFVALSEPVDKELDSKPKIVGMIEAERLRELLEGRVASQSMFGHLAWVYVWPDELNVADLAEKLTSPEAFRTRFGLTEPTYEKEV